MRQFESGHAPFLPLRARLRYLTTGAPPFSDLEAHLPLWNTDKVFSALEPVVSFPLHQVPRVFFGERPASMLASFIVLTIYSLCPGPSHEFMGS